jgi:DNA transposase THAP9
MIGFGQISDVDQLLADIEAEVSGTRRDEEQLASHVLQLMVRGISTSILTTFAYFATKTLTANQLYPILWEAVEILEAKGIRVLAFVSDGAAANRAFYKMSLAEKKGDNWYTKNPYDRTRNIYFVCDVPHLLKTVRNCMSNSGSHKNTRLLWKNDKHIEWSHIISAYQNDLTDGIRKLYHITDEHLHLNPCSLMKVKLAAQVLSRRMSIAVKELNCAAMSETITFIETFDKWFDMLNTRNLLEGDRTRNENRNPYYKSDDKRLEWLTKDFIDYLDAWERDVMQRSGDFTKAQRSNMLLSRATIDGLKITGTYCNDFPFLSPFIY